MNDKVKNSLATEALDDYLSDLLTSDEPEPLLSKMGKAQSLNKSTSKLYHLDSHPSRKSVNRSDSEKRHDIERVERLLDDFNQKQRKNLDYAEPQNLGSPTQLPELNRVLAPEILFPEDDAPVDDAPVDDAPVDDETVEQISENEQTEPTESANEQVQHRIIIPENIELVREDWSHQKFQTLLFDVAGLTLSAPLVKLGGIHRITEDITPLFGKPDWFLGLTPGLEGNINVIDTSRWVMPDKYNQLDEKKLDYKFIILLGDSNWGLACNKVQNAIQLDPEKIRWRSNSGKRPWLAGMLIEEMCALLDVDTLIYLLNENFPR